MSPPEKHCKMLGVHDIIVVVLLVFSALVHPFTLPTYIKTCSINDPQLDHCLLTHGNEAIPYIAKGENIFNIPPMNPYKTPFLQVSISPSLNLNFTEVELFGLGEMKMVNASHSISKNRMTWYTSFVAHNLTIISNYKIDGNISIMAVQGEGRATISFLECEFQYNFQTEPFVKNDGQKYSKVVNDTVEFVIKDASFQFDKFFNGAKDIGDQFNNFLNTNVQEVLKEIRPSLEKTLHRLCSTLSNKFFSSFSVGQLFT